MFVIPVLRAGICVYFKAQIINFISKIYTLYSLDSRLRGNDNSYYLLINMHAPKKQFKTIDEYIETFPKDVQGILEQVRNTVKNAAPESEEAIAYQMPTFRLKGKNLVHFAAFKKHIGFYPTPSGISAFEKELSAYKSAKGSVQFPIEEPVPFKLIEKIVKFRTKENLKGK